VTALEIIVVVGLAVLAGPSSGPPDTLSAQGQMGKAEGTR
jgi:hypothetical protein